MNYRQKRASKAVGHYASLWSPGGTSTTITDQRKSHARELAAAKRKKLLEENPDLQGVARKLDGVTRRWSNTRGGNPD